MTADQEIASLIEYVTKLEGQLEKVKAKSSRRKMALKQTNAAITALRLRNELSMGTITRQGEIIDKLRMELKSLQTVRAAG